MLMVTVPLFHVRIPVLLEGGGGGGDGGDPDREVRCEEGTSSSGAASGDAPRGGTASVAGDRAAA